jgi:peptide/nickel transport system permease protein
MLFGLVTLVFFLSRLLPGDPSSLFISPGVPPSVAEHLRTQFGLDRPVIVQYFSWLESVAKGELGYSFAHAEPVSEVLSSVFPNTVILGLSALIIEAVMAMLIAAISVAFFGSPLDRFLARASLVVYSLPSFWIGILLLLAFSFGLNLFPSSQMYSTGLGDIGGFEAVIDLLSHLVLPALTVSIPGAAMLARYIRSNVTGTLGQEYVIAAQSMGLSKMQVFGRYVLPNSLGPVVSLLGIEMGILLTGVLVTETLFAWPGMGRIAVMAIFTRDYPMILGCTLVGGIVVVLANMVADVLKALLDPRIRMS